MADAGVLELVVLDVDLDFEPRCDSPLGCPRVARWSGLNSCCGQVDLRCDGHKRAIESLFERYALSVIKHMACGVIGGTVAWTPLSGGVGSHG